MNEFGTASTGPSGRPTLSDYLLQRPISGCLQGLIMGAMMPLTVASLLSQKLGLWSAILLAPLWVLLLLITIPACLAYCLCDGHGERPALAVSAGKAMIPSRPAVTRRTILHSKCAAPTPGICRRPSAVDKRFVRLSKLSTHNATRSRGSRRPLVAALISLRSPYGPAAATAARCATPIDTTWRATLVTTLTTGTLLLIAGSALLVARRARLAGRGARLRNRRSASQRQVE